MKVSEHWVSLLGFLDSVDGLEKNAALTVNWELLYGEQALMGKV